MQVCRAQERQPPSLKFCRCVLLRWLPHLPFELKCLHLIQGVKEKFVHKRDIFHGQGYLILYCSPSQRVIPLVTDIFHALLMGKEDLPCTVNVQGGPGLLKKTSHRETDFLSENSQDFFPDHFPPFDKAYFM